MGFSTQGNKIIIISWYIRIMEIPVYYKEVTITNRQYIFRPKKKYVSPVTSPSKLGLVGKVFFFKFMNAFK